MFPPAPETRAEYLNPADFIACYQRLLSLTEEYAFKLERLQEYQEPDNPSFIEYKKGNARAALKRIAEARYADREYYELVCRRGILDVRVRVVMTPFTDYLRWEFQTYQISARWGERILVIDATGKSPVDPVVMASDFLLFDRRAVLIHDYDDIGLLRGAWLIESTSAVERYALLAEHCTAQAIPLALFEWTSRMNECEY